MADYEERDLDDLTEEPSQHKLDELRAQGRVAQSRELTSTVALLGVMLAMYFLSTGLIKEISELMRDIFSKRLMRAPELDDWSSLIEILSHCGRVAVAMTLPVIGASFVLGIVTSLAQTGFIVSTETLNPDFERVNPVSGFMRLFSLKSLTEGFKSLLKTAVVASVIYGAIKSQLFVLPSVIGYGIPQLMVYVGQTAGRAFGVVGVLLLATSAFDYWIQWRRFRRQAMMSKSEAKRDLKEREGDPQIKARVRMIQREAARKRMMKAVPKADVIVTNPTHIAVAIQYDPDFAFAPRVLAKGGDYLAERIKAIAREHGIPTVENKPLARTLYKHVKVGQMIPRSLYQAVAEILAYVYKLKGKRLKPSPTPQG